MPQRSVRTWRRFRGAESGLIEFQLARFGRAHCPLCGRALAARPHTRLAAQLPSGADGVDLECRPCRCFHARVLHTPASLHVLRLRRLAAAVLRA